MFTPEELKSVTAPLSSARTLPPGSYISEEIFDVELKNLFHKEWICVAREEQIARPGDYRSVEIVDQPLIVVRLNDGTVHAMSSICPHRAMPVTEDNGHADNFQCPYHLWKFGLDGKLISTPYMDDVKNFPIGTCSLKAVKVEIWEGFIFINLDHQASSLTARLGELNNIVAGYRMGDLVIATSLEFDSPWNWKILLENFMEAYHHIGPHIESAQPRYHAKDSYSSGSIEDGWSVLHMPEAPGSGEKSDGEELPPMEGLSGKQKTEILASVIMPTFTWLQTPSVTFWYQVQPTAYDHMKLTIHTLLPRDIANSPGGKEIAAAVQAGIEHIHLEDISVNEGPWKGLHAPLTQQGPLGPLEESIWQMNQWWVHRMLDP